MDRWIHTLEEIKAHERCSDHIRSVLSHECLSDPEVFDIPRMRTFFSSQFTTASSDLRIKVSYVTAFTNVRSPIHAARVYGSIIKHLIDKTLPVAADISIQDCVGAYGSVTEMYVTFDIVVNIRRGTSYTKVPNYVPDPARSARSWRTVYGDRDPYKDTSTTTSVTSTSTPATTPTNSSSSTSGTGGWRNYEKPLPDIKDINIVAVYGSLRKGQHNHDLMRLKSSRNVFEGIGRTAGELFPLGNTVPGAHFGGSYKGQVVVEVYKVNAVTMAGLDRLEGWTGKEATSNYVRKAVPVTMENGSVVIAWTYEYPRRAATDIIPGGDWAEYRKQYRPRR